jgi:hypothetical protein
VLAAVVGGGVGVPVRVVVWPGSAGLTRIFAWLRCPVAGDARSVPVSFRSGRWAPCAPGDGHGSKTVMRASAWWPRVAGAVAGLRAVAGWCVVARETWFCPLGQCCRLAGDGG